MHGGVADDGDSSGTDGDSNGGGNRRPLLQHRRGLQRSIGGLLVMMWRGERSRRIRERRGAELVWRRRRGEGSIYRCSRWPRFCGEGDSCTAIPASERARRRAQQRPGLRAVLGSMLVRLGEV
jgi:hypothetical protein